MYDIVLDGSFPYPLNTWDCVPNPKIKTSDADLSNLESWKYIIHCCQEKVMIEEIREKLVEVEAIVKENPLGEINIKDLPMYIGLNDYSVKPYSGLVVNLNRIRFDENNKIQVPRELYLEIYESKLKVFKYAKKMVEKGLIYNDEGQIEISGIKYSASSVIIKWLDGVLINTQSELYSLKNCPSMYSKNIVDVIGNYFESRYTNDCYIYKDTHILRTGPHTHGLHYIDSTREEDKRVLLNVIAYYTGKPLYRMTDNASFNQNLDHLYSAFDLYDLIVLRHKNYLEKDIYSDARICKPTFKVNKHNLIEIKEIAHPQMLDSYHDSLKQFEPLPRCVFLYRVFEYAASVHYQPSFKPEEYDPREAIEYYYQKAMEFDFSTLYAVRRVRGRSKDKDQPSIKSKHENFINMLKKESKIIVNEWSNHNFLRTKSIGQIIYDTGRNRVAHGSKSNYRMTYDYQGNYMHINNVNILLELITRYVIEVMNPSIYKLTERATKLYR